MHSHEILLYSSGTDRGETVFVLGRVESLYSESVLKGIGLHSLELIFGPEYSAFVSLKLVKVSTVITENVSTIAVIYIHHSDL